MRWEEARLRAQTRCSWGSDGRWGPGGGVAPLPSQAAQLRSQGVEAALLISGYWFFSSASQSFQGMIKEPGLAAPVGSCPDCTFPFPVWSGGTSKGHLDHTSPRQQKDKGPPVTFLILPPWKAINHPSVLGYHRGCLLCVLLLLAGAEQPVPSS